ncbi:bifunctional apoptosis regulator [Plakobranchus ocellatus]|uniref:Bifunctional apoptosis regulator n=1 Tax=Plakobranchus ocellatus TaxID=259542 RepID=A0AAV4BBB6_9GAST|nr:bifunctional apoptosis regulator [Plakobranchus ocellatus]
MEYEIKEGGVSQESDEEIQYLSGLENHGSSTVQRNNFAGAAADLEEDLACSVCLLLAVQPTTLVCGHTSCRVCLARWYFTSKKKECPMCRQAYHGLPMINIQLRNMIHKLYPDKARQRNREVLADEEATSLVQNYDKQLQKKNSSSEQETDIASFCAGIFIAICSFIVIYLAWYWQSSDTSLLVLKPVQTWKPKDVCQWVEELSWAAPYSSAVLDKHIDGNMLLSLETTNLESVFNMTDSMHQKAFMFAVELLREEGIKMPANLWEYKAVYPGRSLFLAFSMKDFPRTSLLYMYIYFYDDMFLPFVRITTGSGKNEPKLSLSQVRKL